MSEQHYALSTLAVVAGRPDGDGATLNPSIVLASNFRGSGEYVRSHGTSTWAALEAAVGALEHGAALSYASGMAAASAILHAIAPRVLVVPGNCYQGVRALIEDLEERDRLQVRRVDVTDANAVLAAADGADLVWIETPTNPTLDEADLPVVLAGCAKRGVPTVVDNTFATPLACQPLTLGATVVLHSGTKFIGGHSDLTLGLTVDADPLIHDRLVRARTSLGAIPGALEAYLALRGLRTLPLRVERATTTAGVLAERLTAHLAVASVRQIGAMVSFILRGTAADADRVVASVRLVVPATSLGGVETTIERRQKYLGDALVPPSLLRMSVGIEDVEDLWNDLEQALRTLEA